MTFAEAKAEAEKDFGPRVNPRWVLCHFALGRKPAAYEFMLWLAPYWREFNAMHGTKTFTDTAIKLGVGTVHVAFDEFLRHKVMTATEDEVGVQA